MKDEALRGGRGGRRKTNAVYRRVIIGAVSWPEVVSGSAGVIYRVVFSSWRKGDGERRDVARNCGERVVARFVAPGGATSVVVSR